MTRYHDKQYLELLKDILINGREKKDRTGTGTLEVFGRTMRFDLSDGTIPLLTTKKMHLPSIIHEILWYYKGDSNIKYLQENGVRIWNEWADENGDLGPLYPHQFRKCDSIKKCYHNIALPYYQESQIDQIKNAIEKLKNDPDDRGILINLWNVAYLDEMNLRPCHFAHQFQSFELTFSERKEIFKNKFGYYPAFDDQLEEENIPKRKLNLILLQRSMDVFLGCPMNLVQYSIMLRMFCHVLNMQPGELVHVGSCVHLYSNHIEQAKLQLSREPYPSPTLRFTREINDVDDFKYEDFIIENYEFHPTIKAKVAV